MSLQIIQAAINGVVLVLLIAAFLIRSNSRGPLAQAALDSPSTDEQAAASLAARAEAAYARENAKRHMLYAINYTPWL